MSNSVTIRTTQVLLCEDRVGFDNLVAWLDARGFDSATLDTLTDRVDDEGNLKVTLTQTDHFWIPN